MAAPINNYPSESTICVSSEDSDHASTVDICKGLPITWPQLDHASAMKVCEALRKSTITSLSLERSSLDNASTIEVCKAICDSRLTPLYPKEYSALQLKMNEELRESALTRPEEDHASEQSKKEALIALSFKMSEAIAPKESSTFSYEPTRDSSNNTCSFISFN